VLLNLCRALVRWISERLRGVAGDLADPRGEVLAQHTFVVQSVAKAPLCSEGAPR
jgi:hypothetical protein